MTRRKIEVNDARGTRPAYIETFYAMVGHRFEMVLVFDDDKGNRYTFQKDEIKVLLHQIIDGMMMSNMDKMRN